MYEWSPPGWSGGYPLVEVSGSIYQSRFVPTSTGRCTLGQEPQSSWLAGPHGSWRSRAIATRFPPSLRVAQDACSYHRCTCSTHPSPVKDSSEDFGWCWVCWVLGRWFGTGVYRWCLSPCSEAVFGPISFWPVWQAEGGARGLGSLFLILWRLRPLLG